MANRKISELQSRTPALSDLMLVGDPSSGYSYKCTVTALATIIETDIADGYVTIGTTQTISGAKTFSNNLTLTSVANATTTQSKFLTLNASNVVTYRTGSQVLSDIGAADDSLVVHLAGTETITGFKTFQSRLSIDGSLNLLQGAGINTDAGYSNINASSTGFFLTRAIGVHAFFNLANLTTGRSFTFPDVTGTIALTSDITSALTGYVPTSRTLTINGVTQSLAANRTFNVGTVETVNFATGTTGTDVNVSGSPITTTGTITLNIPTASATNRGALSSTDWSTFNNKQSAISLTTTGNSGAATFVSNTLNIPNYTLSGLGGISGSGTTNYIPKFTSSSAIGNSQIFDNGTNVGIGTASPSVKLQVDNNSHNYFQLNSTVANVQTSISAQNTASGNRATLAWEDGTRGAYGDLYSSTYLTFTTQSSEKMRLTSGGSLGIGTSAPSATLDVNGTAQFAANSGSILISGVAPFYTGANISTGTNNFGIGTTGSTYLGFFTNNTERMRLDASGNLQIAQGSGSARLNVTGKANEWVADLQANATSGQSYGLVIRAGTSSGDFPFYVLSADNSTAFMAIKGNGNVGISTASPAYKFQAVADNSYSTLVIAASSQNGNVTGGLTFGGIYNSDNLNFYSGGSFTTKMVLNTSGNLGLGVTPSAWASGYKAFQFGNSSAAVSALFSNGANDFWSVSNAYFDGTSFKYITTGTATGYEQVNGSHKWYQVASGSGGTNISFTQAMTLDASGNLGIGTTSPTQKLDVVGRAVFSESAQAGNNFVAKGTLQGYSGAGAFLSYESYGGRLEAYDYSTTSWKNIAISPNGGNVGIGTTSPVTNLQVHKTTTGLSGVQITNSTTGSLISDGTFFGIDDSQAYVWNYENTPTVFATNNTERMRITSGGNVAIGTSSPFSNAKFQVKTGTDINVAVQTGTTDATGIKINAFNDAGSANIPLEINGSILLLKTGESERARITSTGELLINTTSDAGDYKLQVNGNISSSQGLYFTANTSQTAGSISRNATYGLTLFGIAGSTYDIGLVNKDGSDVMKVPTGTGNVEFAGSIKTAAPSGGTAGAWKLGTTETFSCTPGGGGNGFSTTVVRIDIGGTAYFIPTVTDGWC